VRYTLPRVARGRASCVSRRRVPPASSLFAPPRSSRPRATEAPALRADRTSCSLASQSSFFGALRFSRILHRAPGSARLVLCTSCFAPPHAPALQQPRLLCARAPHASLPRATLSLCPALCTPRVSSTCSSRRSEIPRFACFVPRTPILFASCPRARASPRLAPQCLYQAWHSVGIYCHGYRW
jgi:hypothetical protein